MPLCVVAVQDLRLPVPGEVTVTKISSRPYAGDADLALLIAFAQQATAARLPRATYMKAGDIVWALYTPNVDPFANIHLWFDDDGLAAYAWFEPPLHLDFEVRPGVALDGPITAAVLGWGEQLRRSLGEASDVPRAYSSLGGDTLSAVALNSDYERIALLTATGFEKVERHNVHYSRSLEVAIPEPDLPHGMRLRHATEADLVARAEVHRDSWSVWGRSNVTPETYSRLRGAPVYDQELDVVLEDGSGRLISYCIGWLDAANGVGHFEPVGCRPAYTGRGFARAVTFEGLRRMRARGLHTAYVGTASVNERTLALYPSCGFEEIDRAHHYLKRV